VNKTYLWVVDADDRARIKLQSFLSSRGYEAWGIGSCEQVLPRLQTSRKPSLLILDVQASERDGLQILEQLERAGLQIPAIVLSGVEQVSTVVRAMRHGAADYLCKPVDEGELELAIERVIAEHAAPDVLNAEQRAGSSVAVQDNGALVAEAAFPSTNRRMQNIRSICDQVARADVPVLLLGESGVGKEVLARYIHAQSGREDTFMNVNCAALPLDLLESELFGHERGAFTGAMRHKPGKFELAGQGTILLDEIAEMHPLLQAKLLHVLQDGEYARLGGTRSLRSEARVLAATNKQLEGLLATGAFREDLFFRLNVITIDVPPLRERPEDILPLCHCFVERYRVKYRSTVTRLPRELEQAFLRYHWPGNVRQLENAVKRYLILPDLQHAFSELHKAGLLRDAPASEKRSLRELSAGAAEKTEKEIVLRTLEEVNWNRKQAARQLNICYKSLLNKLRRWQLGSRVESYEPDVPEKLRVACAGKASL
jgi:two-component system, NtrC family, response regulator AtoC